MMKRWELSALTKTGEVIDTTIVEANDRVEALRKSKALFRWQGLNRKMRLRILKK